jgi:hypothetical protein
MVECINKKSYGNTIYFSLAKDLTDEIHGYIIEMLLDLGFNNSYLTERLDISMESISDLYIPLFTEFGIIDILVGESQVHIIFHLNNSELKNKIITIIRKHFNY